MVFEHGAKPFGYYAHSANGKSSPSGSQQKFFEEFMENYIKIESEIGKIVESFTQKYMNSYESDPKMESGKTVTYEQVFTVYRILIIPEELIRKYLCL